MKSKFTIAVAAALFVGIIGGIVIAAAPWNSNGGSPSAQRTVESEPDPIEDLPAIDPTEDPSLDEAGPTLDEAESEPTQATVDVGEAAVDDDVTFKVNSMEVVSSFPLDEYSEGPAKPPSGAKMIAVNVTYKNNMRVPIDIFCGGGSIVLLDREQRNFDPMDNYTDIPGNTICGDDVQPGFRTTNTILFTMPSDALTAGVVLWNGASEEDSSGEVTNVFVAK